MSSLGFGCDSSSMYLYQQILGQNILEVGLNGVDRKRNLFLLLIELDDLGGQSEEKSFEIGRSVEAIFCRKDLHLGLSELLERDADVSTFYCWALLSWYLQPILFASRWKCAYLVVAVDAWSREWSIESSAVHDELLLELDLLSSQESLTLIRRSNQGWSCILLLSALQ